MEAGSLVRVCVYVVCGQRNEWFWGALEIINWSDAETQPGKCCLADGSTCRHTMETRAADYRAFAVIIIRDDSAWVLEQ